MSTDIRDNQNIQDPTQEGVEGLKGLGNSSSYYKNMESLDTFEDQESAKRLKSLLTANYTGHSENWVQDVGVAGLNDSMYDEDITNPKHLQNLADARGEIQSGAAQLAAGLGKAVVTAGTTFAETANFIVSGSIWTLQEGYDAITGKDDSNHTFYNTVLNNSFAQALTDIQEASEEYMPNYRTDEENAADWWDNMFSAQGAANFWGDVIIKNLGFTVGALLSGGATTAALKSIGVASKAAHWMLGTAVGALGEASIEAKHNALDILDKGEQALDTSDFDYREQAIQNSETMTDEEKLIALSELQYNKNLAIQQARADMEKAAITTANSSFALNFAICWGTDLFTMGKILTRGSHGYNKQIQKTIKNASEAAGETVETTEDTIKKSKLSKFWDKVNENYEDEIAPVKYDKVSGKWISTINTKTKAAAEGVLKGLGEGLQEGLQKAAGETSSYYALSNDSPDWFRESEYADDAYQKGTGALKAVVEGLKVFADPETYQEVFAGMFSMVGTPTFGRRQNSGSTTFLGRGKKIGLSGGILGEINDARELYNYYGDVADRMNRANLENIITHIGRMQIFNDKAEEVLKNSDRNTKFEWLNQKENSLYSIAAAYSRAGRIKELNEMLDAVDVDNMTEEQIESYAQMAGAPPVSNDDNVNNQVRANTGFYDASGNLDIQEAKETIKDNITKTKAALESYTKNLEEIRYQLGRGRLSLDEEDELAWLKWKATEHSLRKDEILKKFTDILERCKDRKININDVEVDAVELFQKIANGNWKNKEDYSTEEEYNNSIDSLQEKSLEVILKSLDKISEQLEEEGEAFDPGALLQDFVDMIRLRNSNSLFLRKYMEYLNNPKKLQQKKFSKQKAYEAVNSLKERAKKQIDSKKEKEDIENNLDEVVKRIDSLDDQEKKAEALGNLQEKYPEMFEKIEEFLELKARIVEAINNITGIEAVELGALNALFEKIASESDIKNPISLYNNFYKALEEGYNKSLSEGKAVPKGIKGNPFISTDTWKKAIESIQSIGDNAHQNNNLKNQFNSIDSQGQESQESQESQKSESQSQGSQSQGSQGSQEAQKPKSSTNQTTLAQALSDNYVIAQLVNNITNFKSTSTRNPKVRDDLKIDASKTHNGKQYKAFRILYEDTSNPSNNIYMYALEESDGKLSANIFLLPFFKNGKVEYEELTFSNITGYTSIYDKIEDLQSSILDIPIDENFEAVFKKSDYYKTLSMYSYQYKPFSYENGTKGKEEFLKTLNDRITALTEKLKDLYNFDSINQTSSSSLNLSEDQKNRLKKQVKEVKGSHDLPSVNSVIESFIRQEHLEDIEETKTALENFLTEGNVIVKDSEGHLERVSIDIIPDDDIDIYEDRDNLNSINVNNDTNPSTSSQFLDYWISPIRKLPIHYKNGEVTPYHKTLAGEKALKERDEKLLKIHNVVWEFINSNNPQWTDIVKPDSEITFKVIKEVQDELKDQNVDETIVFMYVGDLPIGILKLDNDTGKTQEGLVEFKKAINEEFKDSGYSSSVQGKECFNSKYTTAVKTIGAGKTILNPSSTNYTNTKTLEELGIEIQDNIALMGWDKDPSINYPASAKKGQVFLKIKNKDTINQNKESSDTYNAIPVSSKTLREMYSSSTEVKEVVNYVVENLKKSKDSKKVKDTLSFLNALFRARFKYSIVKVTDDSITLFSAKEQRNFTIDKNSNTNDIVTNIFRIFGISQFHYMPFLGRQFENDSIAFDSAKYYKIAQQAILTDVSNNNLTTTDRFIAIEPISINNSVNTIFDVTEGTDEEIKNASNVVFTTKDDNDNSNSSSNTKAQNVNSKSKSVTNLFSTDNANNSDDDDLLRQEFEEAEETEEVEKYNDDILQKEINWLAKALPQFTNVERLHIVNKISAMGKKAWGMFKRGLIYIERTGAKGTVYHEAFHAVTDCLLTPQEYQVLLQEGRKKWTDKNLSDLDIEEKLAEDFRVFVELMELAEEDMTPKQLEDYKRILAGVRGLKGEYGTGLTRLEAFYWNIHRGKFANRVLNENLNRGKKDALIEYKKEMNAIKQKAIEDGRIVLKEDGSFDYALAPNGNRSNLGLHQWLQVRTSAFKRWFGDWENNPANASKVVDENGEPKEVYHGGDAGITIFSKNNRVSTGYLPTANVGFFFTDSKENANHYSKFRKYMVGNDTETYSVFLNIKNPLYFDTIHDFREYMVEEPYKDYNEDGDIISKRQIPNEYDGIYVKQVNQSDLAKEIVVFNPNQIKSATDNVGLFDSDNDDIRFRMAGEIGALNADKAENTHTRIMNLITAKAMALEDKSPLEIKQATGWEKGVEGKWKLEEPDFIIKSTDFKKAPFIIDDEGIHYKLEDLLSGEDSLNFLNLKKSYSGKFENLEIVFKDTESYKGYISTENTSKIFISEKLLEKEDYNEINAVLAHELQHLIQNIEGFARGSNLQEARDIASKNITKLKKRQSELEPLIEDIMNQELELFAKFNYEETEEYLKESEKLHEKIENILKEKTDIDNLINQYEEFGIHTGQLYNIYKNVAGEVEARAVSERLHLPYHLRMSSLFIDTMFEDTSPESIIVLTNELKEPVYNIDDRVFKDASEKIESLEMQIKEIKAKNSKLANETYTIENLMYSQYYILYNKAEKELFNLRDNENAKIPYLSVLLSKENLDKLKSSTFTLTDTYKFRDVISEKIKKSLFLNAKLESLKEQIQKNNEEINKIQTKIEYLENINLSIISDLERTQLQEKLNLYKSLSTKLLKGEIFNLIDKYSKALQTEARNYVTNEDLWNLLYEDGLETVESSYLDIYGKPKTRLNPSVRHGDHVQEVINGKFDSDITRMVHSIVFNTTAAGKQYLKLQQEISKIEKILKYSIIKRLDYHQEIQYHYEQKWAYVNLTQEQKQVLESMGINPRMYDSLSLEEKEVLHQCRM